MEEQILISILWIWGIAFYGFLMYKIIKWVQKTNEDRKQRNESYYRKVAIGLAIIPAGLITAAIVIPCMILIDKLVPNCDGGLCKVLVQVGIYAPLAIFFFIFNGTYGYIFKKLAPKDL